MSPRRRCCLVSQSKQSEARKRCIAPQGAKIISLTVALPFILKQCSMLSTGATELRFAPPPTPHCSRVCFPPHQSKFGQLTLLICTAHGYIYGWNKFLAASTYKWYTPPAYMLCLIVPSVTLVLIFLLRLPCVNRSLTRIRQGWERHPPMMEIHTKSTTGL